MKVKKQLWKMLLLIAAMVLLCSFPSLAGEGSDDNSLASLGILTEGAEVTPEFSYSTTEYNVSVPSDTKKLELDPVPSDGGAWIVDISGSEITDGQATVSIVVSAENGSEYTYYLYVTADGAPIGEPEVETEPQTEKVIKQTEKVIETEPETEDPRYIKVDRNSLEDAEKTISTLKTEMASYRSRVGILTKILYGMIGFCVILLFVVINLLLQKRDLKAELRAYRGYGYSKEPTDNYENGQDYNGQVYDNGNYQGYGNAGYSDQAYNDQNYNSQQYYDYYEQGQQTPQAPYLQETVDQQPVKQPKKKEKKAKKVKDDPNAVPKPAKAKKKAKQMPEYQETPVAEYQEPAPQAKKEEGVEVTMIDL